MLLTPEWTAIATLSLMPLIFTQGLFSKQKSPIKPKMIITNPNQELTLYQSLRLPELHYNDSDTVFGIEIIRERKEFVLQMYDCGPSIILRDEDTFTTIEAAIAAAKVEFDERKPVVNKVAESSPTDEINFVVDPSELIRITETEQEFENMHMRMDDNRLYVFLSKNGDVSYTINYSIPVVGGVETIDSVTIPFNKFQKAIETVCESDEIDERAMTVTFESDVTVIFEDYRVETVWSGFNIPTIGEMEKYFTAPATELMNKLLENDDEPVIPVSCKLVEDPSKLSQGDKFWVRFREGWLHCQHSTPPLPDVEDINLRTDHLVDSLQLGINAGIDPHIDVNLSTIVYYELESGTQVEYWMMSVDSDEIDSVVKSQPKAIEPEIEIIEPEIEIEEDDEEIKEEIEEKVIDVLPQPESKVETDWEYVPDVIQRAVEMLVYRVHSMVEAGVPESAFGIALLTDIGGFVCSINDGLPNVIPQKVLDMAVDRLLSRQDCKDLFTPYFGPKYVLDMAAIKANQDYLVTFLLTCGDRDTIKKFLIEEKATPAQKGVKPTPRPKK